MYIHMLSSCCSPSSHCDNVMHDNYMHDNHSVHSKQNATMIVACFAAKKKPQACHVFVLCMLPPIRGTAWQNQDTGLGNSRVLTNPPLTVDSLRRQLSGSVRDANPTLLSSTTTWKLSWVPICRKGVNESWYESTQVQMVQTQPVWSVTAALQSPSTTAASGHACPGHPS